MHACVDSLPRFCASFALPPPSATRLQNLIVKREITELQTEMAGMAGVLEQHAPPPVSTSAPPQRGNLAVSMLGGSQFDALTPNATATMGQRLAEEEEEDDSGWDTKKSKTIEEEELTRANKVVIALITKEEQRVQDKVINRMIDKLHIIDGFTTRMGRQLQSQQVTMKKLEHDIEMNEKDIERAKGHVQKSVGLAADTATKVDTKQLEMLSAVMKGQRMLQSLPAV